MARFLQRVEGPSRRWTLAALTSLCLVVSLTSTASVGWARPTPRGSELVPGQGPPGQRRPNGAGGNLQRQRQEIMKQLAQSRYELAQLFQVEEPDRRAIDAKLQEIFDLERRRQELMVDAFFDARTHMPRAQFEKHRHQIIRGLMGKGRMGDRDE